MASSAFLARLAAFGGQPRSPRLLHVGRPNIGDRSALLDRIGTALDSRWLSNDGPMVLELEERIEALLGVRHCVAVSSGTLGLGLAARALGFDGDVVLPAFTFVASAHALAWQGARPVFCDIDRDTHQLDPVAVERALTPQTTGVIAVHTWGRPCPIDQLAAIAAGHGLDLLIDAAPAFGATFGGTAVGNFGRAEVISLHATKIVNAGEGGAILTNDDELAARARLMRTFGFADNDRVVSIGTNAKMSELAAAMGLSTLERFEEFRDVNEANFERYQHALEGVPGVTLLPYPTGDRCNFHNVVVEIDPVIAGVDRDAVLRLLSAENVLARRYYWPGCHRMEPYRSQRPPTDHDFPVTDLVASLVLSLPTGTGIEPREIDLVCGLLAGIVEHGEEISARLQAHITSPP